MDEVQVDVVETEPVEASFELDGGIGEGGMELCRHEHLVSGDSAVAQRPTDAFLVAVCLGGVDVAVSRLERRADRFLAFGSVRYLPGAEAEHRHPASVVKATGFAVC